MDNTERKIIAILKLEDVLHIIIAIIENEKDEEIRILWKYIKDYIYKFLNDRTSIRDEIKKNQP